MHSHTLLQEPVVVNNIPIAQVGWGTSHLGCFDIEIDDENHKMLSYNWKLLQVDETVQKDDVILGGDLNVFRSEPYFIEITIKGVDKAESLAGLLASIGLRREDSICCGDGFNDLTMVKYGGVGVAMGNAQQVVKDNADYITASCDEDGLVEVVEKFVRVADEQR